MKRQFINLWFLSFFLMFSTAFSQNPEWINYTNGDEIYAIEISGDFIWVGTDGGLVKINRISGDKTFFNMNSKKYRSIATLKGSFLTNSFHL